MIVTRWSKICPARVFDAAGCEVEYCIWCDTETGELERFARENGQFVLDEFGGDIRRIRETRPAPLVIVPIVVDAATGSR